MFLIKRFGAETDLAIDISFFIKSFMWTTWTMFS